jgi:predicted dehydrogenase
MQSSRRDFLKTLAPLVAVPYLLPSCISSKSPGSRLTMGFVGMGIQSRYLLSRFAPEVQVLAVCDVDTTRRTNAQQWVDKFYTENPDKGSAGCKAYTDYRELLERRDIDTVCIATPDHWHATVILEALRRGKDVFCEKPLTHNIQEAIDVMETAGRKGRILQTGSMQRSSREFRIACELVRNGCIGKIDHVDATFSGPPVPCDLPEEEMEPGLDWNFWLGPAPMRPYNSILSPRGIHGHFPAWRNYREYGTGGVGDWGAHHLDIAQWGLGMDDSGPVEAKFVNGEATLIYPNGVPVVRKDNGFGVHFFGSDGEVLVNRGRIKMILKGETTVAWLGNDTPGTTLEAELLKAEELYLKEAKVKLYDSPSHYLDFTECVKSRKKPIANEQVGGRTVISCHLLNQLYYHNQPIKWDPAKLRFADGTGDPAWLTNEVRNWSRAVKS